MNELLLENISHEDLKKYLLEFYSYAKSKLTIERSPKLFFQKNQKNADNLFGKTGYYNPEKEEIHLFITDRHAKDVIRSFAHELIHHMQKLNGFNDEIDLSKIGTDPAYATNDPMLRKMEEQAFLEGNMLFRDWTDMKKVEMKNILNERKLKPSEKEKLIGLEKDISKKSFTKKYGKKKGKQVYYATLTKMAKKKKKSKTMKEENTMKLRVNSKHMEEEGKMEEALPSKMEPPKKKSKIDDILHDLEGERDELQNEPGAGDIGGRLEKSSLASGEIGKSGEAGGIAGFLNLEKMIDDKFKDMDDAQRVRFAEFLAKKAAKAKEEARMQAKLDSGKAIKDPFTGEIIGPKGQLPESKNTPYPVLFEQRERLLKEAYQTREERVYNELVRRFLKK